MKSAPKKTFLSILLAFLMLLLVAPSQSDTGGVPNDNAKGFWTKERMANAVPIELVVDEKTGVGKVQPAAGKTAGSSKGSPSTTILSTTDWPDGAQIAQTAVGKVFFTVGLSTYVCSGALVQDGKPDRAIVLTAGHCAWDQASGSFVTNWMFIPNYDQFPNGTQWIAAALFVRDEFASQTSFNTTALLNDWAFAVLKPIAANLPDSNSNAYPYSESGFSNGSTSFAFGYPAAKPYDGLSLKYAGATIFTDPGTSNGTWGMNSNMTGGASGGPWLSNGDSRVGLDFGKSGSISSLNSYKYLRDSTKMYGPMFNSRTTSTFDAAKIANLANIANTRVKI
jgi:hypothetical protein